VRIEMIREGLQECEARIVVEEALGDEAKRQRLGHDLAKRCEAMLAERMLATEMGLQNHLSSGFAAEARHAWWNSPGQTGYRWFLHSGWQKRSGELFALAGEVQRKLGGD
jgi:hypothetical protein